VAIPINCPGCGKRYSLRDEMRGKSVRCKECQTSFVVAEPPSSPPASRPKAERPPNGDVEPAAPQRKSKKGLFIVGGLVACLLAFTCCGGVAGGGYFIVSRAKRSAENFTSQAAFGDKDFQASWDKALKDAAKASGSSPRVDSKPAGGSGELDGTYAVAAVEVLGQKVPKERMKIYSDYVFRGNTMSYSLSGTKVSGTFKTDANAKPAQLDFTADGATSYCIYKVEGDTLTLCMGGPDPSHRPTEFKSSAKDTLGLIVLKKK
jgi:uncharacterized protein (TIGR03067 family)